MQARAGLFSPASSQVGGYWFFLRVLLLASFLIPGARAEVAIPPLAARVTDLTDTLNPQQRDALEHKLTAFEAAKGSQIAVLIVPTTQPEAIEQYSIRVVEQWKLGRKGVDDGALLLVARDDRKMRLEIGRGLEGAVPDVVAKRITADIIAPYFKEGDFAGGISAGIERLIKVIEGEPLPEPAGKSQPSNGGLLDFVFVLGFGLVILLVVYFLVRRTWLGWLGGSSVVAGATGGFAWAMTGAVEKGITPAFIFFMVGLFVLVHALPSKFSNFSTGSSRSSGGRSSGSGSWSSGGSSGGGSSGSSFSSGGGDFGGGGASSSW